MMTLPKPPREQCVSVVVPLRSVLTGEPPVVRRLGGRPRRLESAPCVDAAAYHRHVSARVDEIIREDSTMQVLTAGGTTAEVLDALIHEVAIESASLAWERARAIEEGRVTAEQTSSRRVSAICRLADLLLEREHMRREAGEMNAVQLAQLVRLFLDDVRRVAEETCGDRAGAFIAGLEEQVTAAGFTIGCADASSPGPPRVDSESQDEAPQR
jgi:hypothetical protein